MYNYAQTGTFADLTVQCLETFFHFSRVVTFFCFRSVFLLVAQPIQNIRRKGSEGLTAIVPSEQEKRYACSPLSTQKKIQNSKDVEAVHSIAPWTGLGMCKFCTEAVHSVTLWTRMLSQVGHVENIYRGSRFLQKATKIRNTSLPKKPPKCTSGAFQGQRTSGLQGYVTNIYIYINLYIHT